MSISETIQEKANYWLSMEIEGCELHKNQIFLEWLRQDKRHQIAFDEEKRLFNEIHTLPKDFLLALQSDVHQNIENRKVNPQFMKKLFPYVAACLLLFIYVGLFMEKITFSKEYPTYAKIQKEILLPDTSTISLDAQTSMHVVFSTKAFHSKRHVYLSKGKAMFNVAHDSENPFIITTTRATIKVIGTKFEVLNYDDAMRINLLEGKVSVSSNIYDEMPITFIHKNQSLILNEQMQVQTLGTEELQSIGQWQYGKYTFNQESLYTVFNEFAKHLDISIDFKSSEVASLPISGTFDTAHFEDFLNTLPMVHPIKIHRDGNQIVIK